MMSKWRQDNTRDFSPVQLAALNQAQNLLVERHAVDEKDIADALNNVWDEACQTAEALVEAVEQRWTTHANPRS